MPTSFYLFLIGSIIAFLPAYWDHGKTWQEVKKHVGKKRRGSMVKLIVLWAIPLSGLLGTIFLGIESVNEDTQGRRRDQQYGDVTNELAHTRSRLNEDSNLLVEASNAVKNASIAVVQNLDRRLSNDQKLQLLSAIDGLPKERFSLHVDQTVSDAKGLANDIYQVFMYDKWTLGEANGGIMLGLPEGIQIRGNASDAITMKAIADEFTAFGLHASIVTNSEEQGKNPRFSNTVFIIIGYKPQN